MERQELEYLLSGSLYYASQMCDSLRLEMESQVSTFTRQDAVRFTIDEKAAELLANPKNYTGNELLDGTETLCELFVEFDTTNPLAFHVLEDVYFFTSEICRGLSNARKMLYILGYDNDEANKIFDECCAELIMLKRPE